MIYLILKILAFILAALAVGWWLGSSWYRLRLQTASREHAQMRAELESASQNQQELLLAKERALLEETHRRRELETRLEEQRKARVLAEQRSIDLEVSLERESQALAAHDAELRALREAQQRGLSRVRDGSPDAIRPTGAGAMQGAQAGEGEQEILRLERLRTSALDAELVQLRQRIELAETERLDLRIRLEGACQERDELARRNHHLLEGPTRQRSGPTPTPLVAVVTAPLAQRINRSSVGAARLYDQHPEAVDDLTRISGIGPKLEKQLNAMGIYQLAQLADLSAEQICWVDEKLSFKGRIHREDWVGQAAALVASGSEPSERVSLAPGGSQGANVSAGDIEGQDMEAVQVQPAPLRITYSGGEA